MQLAKSGGLRRGLLLPALVKVKGRCVWPENIHSTNIIRWREQIQIVITRQILSIVKHKSGERQILFAPLSHQFGFQRGNKRGKVFKLSTLQQFLKTCKSRKGIKPSCSNCKVGWNLHQIEFSAFQLPSNCGEGRAKAAVWHPIRPYSFFIARYFCFSPPDICVFLRRIFVRATLGYICVFAGHVSTRQFTKTEVGVLLHHQNLKPYKIWPEGCGTTPNSN